MSISLREINTQNFREIINLETADHQKGFVAANVKSLADAWLVRHWEPQAIYADEMPVGFVMCGTVPDDPADTVWWVIRYMIDKAHQNKGYGKAAFPLVIEHLKRKSGVTEIRLCVALDNEIARKLYAAHGFIFTGEMEHGDEVWAYTIPG